MFNPRCFFLCRLSEAEEYVSTERIEQLLLRHFEAESLEEIGVRRIEHIKCVSDLIRMLCKVNAYVQSFCKSRSLGTLHELHLNLQDFCANSQDFESLKLGPLKKLPIVWEYFKLPEKADILEIDTKDILDNLRNFLTEKDLWTSRDLKKELENFMMYMMEKMNVQDPYYLGVRLTSMLLAVQVRTVSIISHCFASPLDQFLPQTQSRELHERSFVFFGMVKESTYCRQVLKRAQRDAGQAVRSACEQYKQLAQEDVATSFRSFTSSFLDKENGICTARRDLLQQDTAQVRSSGEIHQQLSKWLFGL